MNSAHFNRQAPSKTPHDAPIVTADAKESTESVDLANFAADGNPLAREKISAIADPIINYQTDRFCKRFCNENKYLYRCTLPRPWGSVDKNSLLCEWGNACYAWMLDDLSNNNRLRQFKGENGARIGDYFFRIANSLPFYERWKDWRFERNVHVPTYIQDMSPEAKKIFYGLRSGDEIRLIAQKLGLSEQTTSDIIQDIITELTRRNRLHLLDPPKTVSLNEINHGNTDEGDWNPNQADIPTFDEPVELIEIKEKLNLVWDKLSAVEQFVLEAFLVEEQDASDILEALKRLNIPIKAGLAAEDTDQQQLYYFRRKTIAKLAKMMK